MTHAIQGLILPTAVVKTVSVEHAVPISLNCGLAFIPMADTLFDHLAALFPKAVGSLPTEFWKLSPSGLAWLEDLSAGGRVAYIETDYFGGVGTQSAAVWEARRTILPPRRGDIGPINDALRLLGVTRTQTQDEFAVAGLGRHRRNEDWQHD